MASRPAASPLPLILPEAWQRQRMLVAVSGGCDSVALLRTLHEAGGDKLVVCHFNHRLRGRASGNDARFVAALAARLGLDYEGDSADIMAEAHATRQPVEVAAREARYRFFASVARRRRCGTLLLAHHADDQVETLLLNLFRGGSLAGLSAMAPASERTIQGTPLRLLRPFLPLWRQEIEAAATAQGWRWREDESNTSPDYTRNRIRLNLLPLLEQHFGRDLRTALWRTAEIAREEDAYLSSLLPPPHSKTLSLTELRALPLALLRRKLLQWLRSEGVPDVGFREVERIRTLLPAGSPIAKVNLPGDHHARRRAGVVFITAPRPPAKQT